MHRYRITDLYTDEDVVIRAESAPKAVAEYFAQYGIRETPIKVRKSDRMGGRFSVPIAPIVNIRSRQRPLLLARNRFRD